ncbi:uncharacterized protein LOC135842476 [Planococcus citri]|uniref:uncharacterized protein LOC135842476 n=1 Tax=Planococcus citri TaxID=170843 RepID=UPI0031F98EE1
MADSQLDKSTIDTTTTTDSDNHSSGDVPAVTPVDDSWQNFKITKSTDANDNEHDFKLLLETPRKSILGDTWICTEKGDKYYLDRAVLASKSNYLARLSEGNVKVDMGAMIMSIIHEDDMLSPIIEVMYGKDLKSVICESNFVDLLKNMCHLEMQIDLDVFKEFIEDTIIPKKEFCHEMIELYFFLLSSRVVEECKCDYLLPTVSQYFSNRLFDAYKVKEFLFMPFEGLLRILLHRNKDKYQDEDFVGRVCAEWICHDFKNRVNQLIKLVNATKHRHGVFRYCHVNEEQSQSTIDFLKKIDENLRMQQLKKYFNELYHYYGDITFDCSQLADEISDEFQYRIINIIDLPSRWATFLKEGRFCDVIIDVHGFPCKLHRIKLLSASPFFYDLFTKNNKSLGSTVNEKSEKDKSIMETHTFDEIDAVAFEKIIDYIYEGEIEITSQDLIINLLQASDFLKIDDLYEKCRSWLLDAENELDITGDFFDLFHYLYENERNSDLHVVVVNRILEEWPNFEDNAFKNISLEVLKEIVAIPELEMETSYEVVNVCSKWIFHDMEKRCHHMYEIAKAANRNYTVKIDLPKSEPLENSVDYSLDCVKKSFTEILQSTALVPSTCDPFFKYDQKPRFIGVKIEGALSIMDEYFNEIVCINLKGLPTYATQPGTSINRHSATIIDDKLFVLFNIDEEFYFSVYLPAMKSQKFISLATDARMDSSVEYAIFTCNDEVFYSAGIHIHKYCFHLNRWITHRKPRSDDGKKWFTSDGKLRFAISLRKQENLGWSNVLRAYVYDYQTKKTKWLPILPVTPSLVVKEPEKWDNLPIKVNVIKNDLCVLFKSKTFFFHWKSQTWSSIDNLYEDFTTFTERADDILFISTKNGAQLYSPTDKKWIADQKLDNFESISAVHTIMK